MKRAILFLGLMSAVSASVAAPNFTYSPTTINPGQDTVVSLDFTNDTTTVAHGVQAEIAYTLPAGVTITNVASSGGFYQCALKQGSTTTILGLGADALGGTALPNVVGLCQVTFTATAAASGNIASAPQFTVADINANAITTTQSISAISINAVTPTTYKVNYSKTGTGTGTLTCTVDGTAIATGADVQANKVVSCTATASSDSELAGVTGGTTLNAGKYELTVDGTETIVATFNKKAAQTLSVTINPPANGQVSCDSGVAGTTVACTATPNAGFRFAGWTGACSGTATTCSVTLPNTSVLGANFSPATVTPPVTQPVPAIGLLGLFGMLASLAGAASLVLRRKTK